LEYSWTFIRVYKLKNIAVVLFYQPKSTAGLLYYMSSFLFILYEKSAFSNLKGTPGDKNWKDMDRIKYIIQRRMLLINVIYITQYLNYFGNAHCTRFIWWPPRCAGEKLNWRKKDKSVFWEPSKLSLCHNLNLVLPVFWDPVCFQYLLQKTQNIALTPGTKINDEE
jgi:hypothetical protein